MPQKFIRRGALVSIIFLVFSLILPVTSASAGSKYSYGGTTYIRYSLKVTVTVTIKFITINKKVPCSSWAPRDLRTGPGPYGSNSVLLRWDKPLCSNPTGYTVALSEQPSFDADSVINGNDRNFLNPQGDTNL